MKSFFIKKLMARMIAVVALFGVMVTPAFAATTINQDPQDLKTVRVSNYSASPGSMNWGSSVNTAPGQRVSVGIYYHNTGNESLQNLRIRLSPQTSSAKTNHTFTATLSADNAPSISDSATVTIVGGSESLSYIPTAVYWYPNQICKNPNCQPVALPLGQNGAELFGSGLNLGTIAPGWATQGGIAIHFQVSNNGTVDPDPSVNAKAPSVLTKNISGLDSANGEVNLRGWFDANGASTTTYFRYRKTNQSSWTTVGTNNNGNTSGDVQYRLIGLASGTYEYQVCATNTHGTKCGIFTSSENSPNYTVVFTIDRSGNDPYDPCDYNDCDAADRPEVRTDSATNIDEDSTTLRGTLEDTGNDTNTLWFEYGRDEDNLNNRVNAGTRSSTGSFSKNISGLREDTRYYFRACAENDADDDCGSIKSFITEDGNRRDVVNDSDTDRPSVTTLGTLSIGGTSAVVDAYFDANGCSVTTWFEYGRTQSLGSTTVSVNRGTASGSMAYAFSSLAPNTTYFYRAVANNCEGATYGTIRSFTTNTVTTINPPTVVTNVVTTNGGGGGNSFIKLMITNNRETVRQGREIGYDITWENISGRDLSGLLLEVNFPEQMTVTETERGDITRTGNSVVYKIGDLDRRETGEMTIFTEVRSGLREGDPVVAQAIIAFENPINQATENAIGYDADEYSTEDGSVLGASLFGLDFFPNSLAGWLLILLIILIIIFLARYAMRNNRQTVVMNNQAPAPVAPAAPASDDYVVYRPMPKQ